MSRGLSKNSLVSRPVCPKASDHIYKMHVSDRVSEMFKDNVVVPFMAFTDDI